MFSKTSDSVYVTLGGRPETSPDKVEDKEEEIKGMDLRREHPGRCCVLVLMWDMLGRHVEADMRHD